MSIVSQGYGSGSIVAQGFGGSSAPLGPFLVFAVSLDGYTISITYNEAVDDTALNPLNYSITPILNVGQIVRITDTIYQVSTSRQTAGVTYTITASNVDAA